jgi:5-methylcytosine-specific restriction endonuclease McrA
LRRPYGFDPDNPRPEQYGKFFLHWVKPPYVCTYCNTEIDHTLHGLRADALVIHHVDHNHANTALDNLMPLHRKCHPAVHNVGMKRSLESRQRMSEAQRAAQPRGEDSVWYGRSHTEESLQLMRDKAAERLSNLVPCEICGEQFAVNILPGHMKKHVGENYHSEAGREAIVEAARERNSKLILCDECQKEWTPLLWPRHIRKYHEGGKW